jgi:hypothetical protein
MVWTPPEVTEVKMDAEIGSYQEDDPAEGPLFLERAPLDAEEG